MGGGKRVLSLPSSHSFLSGSKINLDLDVEFIQNAVYDYFAKSCGSIPSKISNLFETKYENLSIKDLKAALRF